MKCKAQMLDQSELQPVADFSSEVWGHLKLALLTTWLGFAAYIETLDLRRCSSLSDAQRQRAEAEFEANRRGQETR